MTRTIRLVLAAILLAGGVILAALGANGPNWLYLSLALVALIAGVAVAIGGLAPTASR